MSQKKTYETRDCLVLPVDVLLALEEKFYSKEMRKLQFLISDTRDKWMDSCDAWSEQPYRGTRIGIVRYMLSLWSSVSLRSSFQGAHV